LEISIAKTDLLKGRRAAPYESLDNFQSSGGVLYRKGPKVRKALGISKALRQKIVGNYLECKMFEWSSTLEGFSKSRPVKKAEIVMVRADIKNLQCMEWAQPHEERRKV
jgi:hypothetical protein